MPNKKQATGIQQPRAKKSILLVDDHTVFRVGLNAIIKGQTDLEVGGEAESYASGLSAIRSKLFDLVILDIGLGIAADGLELIKSLKVEQPDLHVLIVSIRDESVYASRGLRAGAGGYLMKKDTTAETLLKALRQVFSGEIYLSAAMHQRLLALFVHGPDGAPSNAVDLLSDRELEVLHLVGHGVDVKNIATKLNLSPKTVQTYRDRIRQKLVFADARELARFAHEWVGSEQE